LLSLLSGISDGWAESGGDGKGCERPFPVLAEGKGIIIIISSYGTMSLCPSEA